MRLAAAIALVSALSLAACGRAPEEAAPEPAEPAAPAATPAQTPAATDAASDASANVSGQIADMIDCAGAFGAAGNIDPTSPTQNMDAPWVQDFSGIQMAILTAPGSPGADAMSSRTMARVAHWKNQPQAAQLARAEACKAQYR